MWKLGVGQLGIRLLEWDLVGAELLCKEVEGGGVMQSLQARPRNPSTDHRTWFLFWSTSLWPSPGGDCEEISSSNTGFWASQTGRSRCTCAHGHQPLRNSLSSSWSPMDFLLNNFKNIIAAHKLKTILIICFRPSWKNKNKNVFVSVRLFVWSHANVPGLYYAGQALKFLCSCCDIMSHS